MVSRLNSHRLIRRREDRLVLSGGRCELGIRCANVSYPAFDLSGRRFGPERRSRDGAGRGRRMRASVGQ